MTVASGQLAGALTVVLVAVLWPADNAAAQISPGPLSRPHADLDGNNGCLECHSPERGVDPELCLECHVPLSRRIEAGIGLHASDGYTNCARCHVDHHGAEFELVWWGDAGTEGFDHALVGYLLEGKHEDVTCRDCHRAANVPDTAADELRLWNKDLDRTFLGLDRTCDACHFDEHRQQFGATGCDSCHAGSEWTPVTFEHDASRFPLRGLHKSVDCAECHEQVATMPALDRRGRSVEPAFTSFRNGKLECASCHADEHREQFGDRECESCHVESGWRPASGFDHDDSRYPLTGLHGGTACADCHQLEAGVVLETGDRAYHRYRPLTSASCDDCHTDTHEGRLEGACSDCHTTAGWGRRHTDFDHALTRYVLEGKHAEVKCEACHTPGTGYRIENSARCEDCHGDAHYGQVELDAERGCDDCHSVDGFEPAAYSTEDHAATGYPLTGTHLEVACAQCHVSRPVGRLAADGLLRAAHEVIIRDAAVLTAQLRFAGLVCESCHVDPHDVVALAAPGVSVSTSVVAVGGAAGVVAACSSCHTTTTWSAVDFDHATTGFVLDGRHSQTPCTGCHLPAGGPSVRAGGVRSLPFTGAASSCEGCHEDEHRAQFAAGDGTGSTCERCHGTAAWGSHEFDHGTSRFLLEGGHATAACRACHRAETDSSGNFVRYRPLATECEACHTSPAPGGLP